MTAILGLFTIVLAIVSIHACSPPHGMMKSGRNSKYNPSDVVNVACTGHHNGCCKVECTSRGTWLLVGPCDPPKPTTHSPSPPKKDHHKSFDHYHPPGDPYYHKDDTPSHYHPGSAKVVKPPSSTVRPRPPATKPSTLPPRTRPQPKKSCPSIPNVTPYGTYQFPYGFSVIGIPCPQIYPDVYPGMFDITCDPDGSGQWLWREDSCGYMQRQQPRQPTYNVPQQPIYNVPQQPIYNVPQQPTYNVPQQQPFYNIPQQPRPAQSGGLFG